MPTADSLGSNGLAQYSIGTEAPEPGPKAPWEGGTAAIVGVVVMVVALFAMLRVFIKAMPKPLTTSA